jgi:hypothetical protein
VNDSAPIPSAEHLAGLRRAREGALLLRFCDGNILGTVEMAEVAHIVPPEVLSNPPPPRLAREIEAYAADLGTSKRTVFRWLELGRSKKDHVPLDDPPQMIAWWARNMSHKVPSYLQDWASRSKSAQVNTVPTSATTFPAGVGATEAAGRGHDQPLRTSIDIRELSGHGLDKAVEMLRQVVEANAQQLSEAFKDPNDQRLSQHQSRFDESVEQLRKAEGSLIALQKSRGDLAPRAQFRSDLHTLLTGLRGMMRRRADNICSTMSRHLNPEQLGLLRAAIVAEGASEEQLLRTSRHWSALPTGELHMPAA